MHAATTRYPAPGVRDSSRAMAPTLSAEPTSTTREEYSPRRRSWVNHLRQIHRLSSSAAMPIGNASST